MGRVCALAVLVALSVRAAAEPLATLGPCGPVDRPYDPVELPAARLRDLKGTAVGRLGLVASRAGRVRPIPFQVDQRGGRKLALPEGSQPTLNEQQGQHQLIAWKGGAVRVVRRSLHQVRLGLGIHLTAARAHTYFYPRHVFGPGSMKLPISPGWVFREIVAFGGADFRDLRGWRYHAPGTPPEGFRVDGHMEEAERAFDASGEWFLLARGEEAIMMVTRLSETLRRAVRIKLVYVDDAERHAPPEAVPGSVPLVGYRGLDV